MVIRDIPSLCDSAQCGFLMFRKVSIVAENNNANVWVCLNNAANYPIICAFESMSVKRVVSDQSIFLCG